MLWKETSPGTFFRPLTHDETCFLTIASFHKINGREHWGINLAVTITPHGSLTKNDIPPLLRRGLAHLRFRQPVVGASLSDNNVVYTVPSATALEEWLQKSFFVLPEVSSAVEVRTRDERSDCQLYYIPQSNEVLFSLSHWRIDGVGTMLLLDHLLRLAFDPNVGDPGALPWGEEVTRFNPTTFDIIPAQEPLTAVQEAKLKNIQISYQKLSSPDIAGIPYRGDATTPPGLPVSHCLALSPETTTKIIKACKQRGCTVTSAAHASVAMVHFARQLESHRARNYGSLIVLNVRRFLPEKYGTTEFGTFPLVSGWGTQMPPGADWETYCRRYQSHYSQKLLSDDLAVRRELLAHILKPLPDRVPVPNDPSSAVMFQSMGIVDKWIQSAYGSPGRGCAVHTVALGIDVFDRNAFIYMLTFRGRLSLNITYNEGYHDREQMTEFSKAVVDVLLKELQIEE